MMPKASEEGPVVGIRIREVPCYGRRDGGFEDILQGRGRVEVHDAKSLPPAELAHLGRGPARTGPEEQDGLGGS